MYLTDIGRKESEYVVNAFNVIEKAALKDFSQQEREQFITFLKKANDNLLNKKESDNNAKK